METQVQIPEFKTGIYRHYKNGKLYFAEGLEVDKDQRTEVIDKHNLRVRYHALYPGEKLPFSRVLANFEDSGELVNKPAKRFILVKDLPAESAEMLLPGSVVTRRGGGIEAILLRGKVQKVVEKDGVLVVYHGSDTYAIGSPLDIFLKDFSPD